MSLHISSASSAQRQVPFAIQLLPGALLVFGMPFLTVSPRWTARFRGREEAVKQLAKLRGLSEGHEYVLEEVYRILDQIGQERRAGGAPR
jgi:hypothetical protein